MRENRPPHLSYLLRLWQAGKGQVHWRASLESPLTGRRQGFPDLESLFDYIRVELQQAASQDKPLERQHYNDDTDEAA